MRHFPIHSFVLAATLAGAGSLRGQQTRDLAPFLDTDRPAAIVLARSAAPHDISDSASVLLLTRTGFEQVAKGSNGFTCFTLTGFFAEPGDSNFWNPRIRAPHCLNAPAMRSVFPEMRQRAEWILAGVPEGALKQKTADAYAAHQLPLPEAGAMAYMLSPRQYLVDGNPHWVPHLMFYYPGSVAAGTWGPGGEHPPVIDGSNGDPKAPVRLILIPVPRWSDGTIASTGH